MKQLFSTLFVLLSAVGMASAQSFSLANTEVWTIASQNQPDVEAHTSILNLMNTPQTFRWERIVINMTPGCASRVCDINVCYIASVSSKLFTLEANAGGPLILHFDNPDSIAGANAIIRLKVTNANLTTDTASVVFLYTSDLSDTKDKLPAANVKLFPNPTSDYFQLENAEAVSRIRVFSLDGRNVAEFAATPGQQYYLTDLPSGSYLLALEDKAGQAFQALEVVKK